MFKKLRSWLHRLLRVPAEPSVPQEAGAIRIFRAAPNYYRYKVALWILAQLSALFGIFFGFFLLSFADGFSVRLPLLQIGESVAVVLFVAQLPFSYALLRLDFELRWYVLSESSLRIRQGILSLREKTMTFANIQQIAIRENPLQRVLGIADVVVRTAGGGAAEGSGKGHLGEAMHEAWFRGVDNAEEIRSAIQERVKRHKDTGLGDPDEVRLRREDGFEGPLAAAGELHREVRELRRSLSGATIVSARQNALARPPDAPERR